MPLRVRLNCPGSREHRRILDSLSNKSQNLAPRFFYCREAMTAVWVSLWPCHVLTPPTDPMELFSSQDVCPAPSCYPGRLYLGKDSTGFQLRACHSAVAPAVVKPLQSIAVIFLADVGRPECELSVSAKCDPKWTLWLVSANNCRSTVRPSPSLRF